MGEREWDKAVKNLAEAKIIEVKQDITTEEVAQKLKELTRKKSKSGQAARRLLVAHGELVPRGEVYVIGGLHSSEGDPNEKLEAVYFSPKGLRRTGPTTLEAIKQGAFEYDFTKDKRASALEAVNASLDSMNGNRRLYEVIPTFVNGLDIMASKLEAKARKLQFGTEVV